MKVGFKVFLMLFIAFNVQAKNMPTWINDISSECAESEICAVGSAESLALAKADARNNILKYFETNIESIFKNNVSFSNNIIKELTSDEIEEVSKGILKGVVIIKTYQSSTESYALAKLNKEKTINELKYDIEKLDSKMKIFVENEDYKNAKQLERLYIQREDLNRKYLFLTNNSIPEVIKYEEVFKKKNKNNESYYILIDEKDERIKNIISKILLDNGNTIVKNENVAKKMIVGFVVMERQYLNVAGFEKYSINLTIECREGGKVIGILSTEIIENGRNKEDIYNKAVGKIDAFINENIDNLIN